MNTPLGILYTLVTYAEGRPQSYLPGLLPQVASSHSGTHHGRLAGVRECVHVCVYRWVTMFVEQHFQGPAGRFDYDFLEAPDTQEPWFLVVNIPWQGKGS